MSADDSRPLERVRDELKRLGYLDHGFERFLLQDALKPRRPLRALLGLAFKVAILAGTVLALVLAFVLAAANGNLAQSPFDLLPLFLHLFPPIALTVALGFLALGLVLVGLLRLTHVRRIEGWSLGIALMAGLATLLLAVWKGPDLLAESDLWHVLAVALAVPLVIFAVVRVLYNGLLSLAISLTDAAPRGRLFRRRWLAVAILGSVFLLLLPGVLAVERRLPLRAPPSIPAVTGERVLLVGIDGVLTQELDYLLARGELPTLARLAGLPTSDEPTEEGEGGRLARYSRGDEPPAVFWTSVATGLAGSAHGVSALDSFRPLGVATALARSGPLRDYWGHVEVPLGLAVHRPLLANRRSAFTVWELASRGGHPVLAVQWWSTFPAEPLPGLVVAHGAFPLLGEGVAEAVTPADRRDEVDALREAARVDDADPLAGLPPEASEIERRALAPDRFAREVFRRNLEPRPRMAALYLAAPDLAADGWRWGEVAFADLVRRELRAADDLLAEALPAFATVAVVVDPGRRATGGRLATSSAARVASSTPGESAAEGRALLWRRIGCGSGEPSGKSLPTVPPEAIASGLLRALGLPQSEELPPPPGLCSWSSPPSRLASFGQRRHPEAPSREGREYLESLRSLGYL